MSIPEVDVQAKVHDFLVRRPVMQAHDSPEAIVRELIPGEGEEFLAEIPEGRPPNEEELERMRKEIADMAIYLFHLAGMYDIDVLHAVLEKLALNEVRFPEELFQEGDFATIYHDRKVALGEWKE